MSAHIFHIATAADWAAAQRTGAYTTSTRGVTLEQDGFIHAARHEQVAEVWRRYYADAGEPLVVLTIDTDRLTSPWREDQVGDTTYPHVYGPLHPSAVVRVQTLDSHGRAGSFTATLVREIFVRIGLAVVAMMLAVAGSGLGRRVDEEWGAFAGAVAGLTVGAVAMTVLLRRRG